MKLDPRHIADILTPRSIGTTASSVAEGGRIRDAAVLHNKTVVTGTLQAAADAVADDEPAIEHLVRLLIPRWLRPFVNVAAIAEAVVAFVRRRLSPVLPDPDPIPAP